MAKSEEELRIQKKRILERIETKGGKKNAPGLTKRLERINQRLTRGDTIGGGSISRKFLAPKVQKEQTMLGREATEVAREYLPQLGGPFQFDLTGGLSPEMFQAERARIEADIFDRLTKNLLRDEERERNRIEQSLYDRGIPYSADPESRYQQELRANQERFDAARQEAQQRATEIGGQEFSRYLGNLQQMQLGQRQQQFGELEGLSQLGMPGTQFYEQLLEAQRQRQQQGRLARQGFQTDIRIAGMRGGGGGGYSSTPFMNSPYPGF